jgi:hypothetical protein
MTTVVNTGIFTGIIGTATSFSGPSGPLLIPEIFDVQMSNGFSYTLEIDGTFRLDLSLGPDQPVPTVTALDITVIDNWPFSRQEGGFSNPGFLSVVVPCKIFFPTTAHRITP